jgi:hypothetical protein
MAKEGMQDVDDESYIDHKASNAARPAHEPIDSKGCSPMTQPPRSPTHRPQTHVPLSAKVGPDSSIWANGSCVTQPHRAQHLLFIDFFAWALEFQWPARRCKSLSREVQRR